MTDTAPGALDTVRLILNAQANTNLWGARTREAMLAARPQGLKDYDADEWLTTVAIFKSGHETGQAAAERLAHYLLAFQETYGRMPTLGTIQQHAATRHLEEPRE